jgi:hypothetical protein
MTNLNAATTINICKRNFSRHGIPRIVCTDNATNFSCEEFIQFSRAWELQHVTSSLHHQQGNGKSEAAVKIAKNLIRKSMESDEDYFKSLLIWRNTHNKMESSPANIFKNNKTPNSGSSRKIKAENK